MFSVAASLYKVPIGIVRGVLKRLRAVSLSVSLNYLLLSYHRISIKPCATFTYSSFQALPTVQSIRTT